MLAERKTLLSKEIIEGQASLLEIPGISSPDTRFRVELKVGEQCFYAPANIADCTADKARGIFNEIKRGDTPTTAIEKLLPHMI